MYVSNSKINRFLEKNSKYFIPTVKRIASPQDISNLYTIMNTLAGADSAPAREIFEIRQQLNDSFRELNCTDNRNIFLTTWNKTSESSNECYSILHYASAYGLNNFVKSMLRLCPELLNAQTMYSELTPLMMAVMYFNAFPNGNSMETIKTLLANPGLDLNLTNSLKENIISFASRELDHNIPESKVVMSMLTEAVHARKESDREAAAAQRNFPNVFLEQANNFMRAVNQQQERHPTYMPTFAASLQAAPPMQKVEHTDLDTEPSEAKARPPY